MIYYISKLFTSFFLPPGIFILPLLVGIWISKRYRYVLVFISILFYALSISPVANVMLGYFENPYRTTLLPKKADAVVMLGGGDVENGPNLPLRSESLKRALYALVIAKKMNIPLVVSGGGLDGYKETEGFLDTMKDLKSILTTDMNVSKRYENHFTIILESKSLDTYQNAFFTKRLLPQKNPKVIVVTSAYHMKRSLMLFKLNKMKAFPAATDFHIEKRAYKFLDFLPNMLALENSYRALHEAFGIVKARLRLLYD